MRRLACLLLAVAPASLAAPAGKVLAVLEFDSKLNKDQVDAGYLADVVRTAAKDAAPGLKVITRESMLVLLEASGKKLEDCQGECEVDTGRRLGADLVISGHVLKFGTQFKVNMKLHATASGELLEGAQASGATLDELDRNLNAAVRKLIAPIVSSEPSPAPQAQQPSAWSQQQVATRPPPPAQSSEPMPFTGGVAVNVGYYNWSIDAAGTSASSSGLTYGLSGDVEYRFGNLALGLMLQYDWLQYTDSNAQSQTSNGLGIGPILKLQLGSGIALFAAAGFLTLSENQGSGLLALGGVDIPIAGPFHARIHVQYRHASTTATVSGGGVGVGTPLDITSSIISGAGSAALVF